MAILGNLDHVKRMLRPNTSTSFDVDVDERLELIQAAVSAALEERMGRSFGTPATDTTHVVYAGRSPVLILPLPARSITGVTSGGTITGGTVTGGTAVANTEYAHDPIDRETGLIYGLRKLSGYDWGRVDAYNRPTWPVVVVGDFADSDNDAAIPDDVQYIANFLISERYKLESASPAGFIGPDGNDTAVRDAWADPMVKSIIERYRQESYRQVVI